MNININKTSVCRLIKATAFMTILALLLMTLSYMLAPKDNTEGSGINNPNANGFFSEMKNSIDISVIGNSDAYSGFSPMELWNKYGYTSYVSAEGRQVTAQSLNILNKTLTCQSPKVVILETDGFFTKTDFSQNVANLLNTSMGSTFSVFQYHDRWKMAKPGEMLKKPRYTAHCSTKGQMLSNDIKGYMGGEYMNKNHRTSKIPLSTMPALNSIVKLCRERGIELILLEIPSQSSWTYEKHNAVQKFADENALKFFDLNLDRSSFGFDWKHDSRDGGNHLNTRGARKVTLHIGKYLSENYQLTDHRKDSAYNKWHEDYKSYISENKI